MSPFRLPVMLMVPMNDLPDVMAERMLFTTLAIAMASPVVALPALVLAATVALPLVLVKSRSLLMLKSLVFVTVRSLVRESDVLVSPCTLLMVVGSKSRSPVTSPSIV